MLLSSSEYRSLSTQPGIYLFLNKRGDILYVGKAKNLKNRVSSYFLKNIPLGTKTSILVSQIAKIKTISVNSELEAFLLENLYIKKYKPKYNIKLTDDKAYPMIKISLKDKYPKILTVRKIDDPKAMYFGPFPNGAQALRLVLKTIRKIFPFQSVQNHAKRICLYHHLGLCPCPPIFNRKQEIAEYKKDVRHIIDFLNGKSKKIIKDLEKEREAECTKEQFEKANVLQNKINAIKLITGPFYGNSLDLSINPNLDEDLKNQEISELIGALNKNNYNLNRLDRIECFDISNISGTNPTGSMVTFTDGVKDGKWYRKFKVKTLVTPNDFGMLDEVLRRRLKHQEWPLPDLLIVDGGKGQVAIATKIIKENKLSIPIIGLAKKEETIITSDLKEIYLPNDSIALKLIMRIRDEAHRFAITYHRKLRSKSLLQH